MTEVINFVRKAVAGLLMIGSAVSCVLAAAHTKKEMIDLRREKMQKLFAQKEEK
ncbi:MAG: hypothetical protein ABS901_00910 [Candidatus Limivicinus sp.]